MTDLILPVLQTARSWIESSKTYQNKRLNAQSKKLQAIIKDDTSKAFLVAMFDHSFRCSNAARLCDQIAYLVRKFGIPKAFSGLEKVAFRFFVVLGSYCPSLSVKLFYWKLRYDTQHLMIPYEKDALHNHILGRQEQGYLVNVNIIGEDTLCERDALKRMDEYLDLLDESCVTHMSIKLSAIYSKLHPLGFKNSKEILIDRLSTLFRKAMSFESPKFIYLDMESYKDSFLTLEVFKDTLTKEDFRTLHAGIVIQAYLPDSLHLLEDLVSWATARVKSGGVPIRIRLVKGANLQMETVMATLENTENPVYSSKAEVDANYKRLLTYMCQHNRMMYVHMGVASHNVIDMAFAWHLVTESGMTQYMCFEMLEGMSPEVAAFLQDTLHTVMLYTPIVRPENFDYAVSYLFRRLDENTGPKNFLNHIHDSGTGSINWTQLESIFNDSISVMSTLFTGRKRAQNRLSEPEVKTSMSFENEDNTDFYLPENRYWAESIRDTWKERALPSVPSHTLHDITVMLKTSVKAQGAWRKWSVHERQSLLCAVADKLRQHRGDLIGLAACETGKTFTESDVEVSEAIDFATYYGASAVELESLEGVDVTPKGTVLVIAPWNFPIAIPIGGVFAGLATGNTVILKPSNESAALAHAVCQYCWEAGIPKDVLQLALPNSKEALEHLTASSDVNHIIFTGSTQTAYAIKRNAPLTPLSAETGGKNAIYVSDLCDVDLAIHDIVVSAFGNAGQKCSACSLVLLHKDHYHNEHFLKKLKEKTENLTVAEPWVLSSDVGPMIYPPTHKLTTALRLEPGESWLVEPVIHRQNPALMSPGIKLGVGPTHYSFLTELFAPLLSIICVSDIEEALTLINASEYGLTSGIVSLDEREIEIWQSRIEAGNLYINRPITGAVVQRQAFGGIKASSFGVGIKAGGPNYVQQFCRIDETKYSDIDALISHYKAYFDSKFNCVKDVSHIYGEHNYLRYRPVSSMLYRIQPGDSPFDVTAILAAAQSVGCSMIVSYETVSDDLQDVLNRFPVACVKESLSVLLDRLNTIERLRFTSPVYDDAIITRVSECRTTLVDHRPYHHARFELLYYLTEQSVSHRYHRYGNTSYPVGLYP